MGHRLSFRVPEVCTGTRNLLFLLLLLGLALSISAQSKKSPPEKPLDLNSATVDQLQTLPSVGPVTAKAIVRFREKSGPFRRVEDLLVIRGITKKRLEQIRAYVIVVAPPDSTGRARPKPTARKM